MNDLNCSSDYWKEINSIADSLVSESMADNDNDRQAAEDEIQDSRLPNIEKAQSGPICRTKSECFSVLNEVAKSWSISQ